MAFKAVHPTRFSQRDRFARTCNRLMAEIKKATCLEWLTKKYTRQDSPEGIASRELVTVCYFASKKKPSTKDVDGLFIKYTRQDSPEGIASRELVTVCYFASKKKAIHKRCR